MAKGAGLHEKCWRMAKQVAKCVYGEPGTDEHIFNPSLSAEEYAPRYWREAHTDNEKRDDALIMAKANDAVRET